MSCPKPNPLLESTSSLCSARATATRRWCCARRSSSACSHGDHKAAILLSQILYWSDRTKDADGWFYKSYADWTAETGLSEAQVRRIVNGDPRVHSPQLTLRDLGVETLLRKVKHTGAPTLHYRINQAQFLGVLHGFLGQGDSSQCAESISGNAEDEPRRCRESTLRDVAHLLIQRFRHRFLQRRLLRSSDDDLRSIHFL